MRIGSCLPARSLRHVTSCLVIQTLFIGSIVFGAASAAHAELVFNLSNPKLEERSRTASAELLSVVSKIFDALEARERRDQKGFAELWPGIEPALSNAAKEMAILAREADTSGRKLDLPALGKDRFGTIAVTFKRMRLALPGTEAEIARLASNELGLLAKTVRGLEFTFGSEDQQITRRLVAQIIRLLRIGTLSAEIATTAK